MESVRLDMGSRLVARIELTGEVTLDISHYFITGPCTAACPSGKHLHASEVWLKLLQRDDDDVSVISAMVDPATVLLVANRLTRAANLALEAEESIPADDPDDELENLADAYPGLADDTEMDTEDEV